MGNVFLTAFNNENISIFDHYLKCAIILSCFPPTGGQLIPPFGLHLDPLTFSNLTQINNIKARLDKTAGEHLIASLYK